MSTHLHLVLILRIAIGTALGAIIGYERDVHGRPAGLRTHALVALASATFMVVSTYFVYEQHYGKDDGLRVDGSRIASQVVAGIGFLAGGAILRTGISVQGLTTAAGLWLVAAIGLAAGGGMYFESCAATVVGVLVLTAMRRFEDKDDRSVTRRLTLELNGGAPALDAVLAPLAGLGCKVTPLDQEATSDGRTIHFDLRLPLDLDTERVIAALRAQPGVLRIKLHAPH